MSRSRTYRPSMERLEDRCMPSTFMVKNLKDSGLGSLRQAIINANAPANPDADTIVFKAGLQGTIKLTSGVITISDSLVLAGPGAAKIRVNGSAASGIFRINDATGTAKDVTIRGLTLFNGSAVFGAAIDNSENLTLVKTIIRGNHASSSGGGLYTEGPQTTIRASRIVGNEALNKGGGIRGIFGTVRIENSKISGNSAGDNGGGINMSGTLTVRNTVLSGNTTDQNGGGLYTDGNGTGLTIANSTITGNYAVGQGGGLFTKAVLSTVTNTKISFNTAKSSGGGVLSSGVLEIDRSTISGNTSREGRGGGIRHSVGLLKLRSSTVSGNHANLSQGGGIFVNNTTDGTSIRGCTIAGNTADAGGGIWSENSILKIDRSVISGNTARTGDGGGIAVQFSYLHLNSSTVRGNHADQSEGGGILLLNINSASIIQSSTISANTAQFGGGLAARNCPNPVVIQNSTISGNRAGVGGAGGGIYLQDNTVPLIIQNSTVAFNRAGSSGGGIQARSADVILESTIVAKNRATVTLSPDLYSYNPDDDFQAFFSLIGSTIGATFTGDGTTNFLTGRNPLLAPLANNGGPTQTHALKAGSRAINNGSLSAPLTTDQRGLPFKRVKGLVVDIGAFERQ